MSKHRHGIHQFCLSMVLFALSIQIVCALHLDQKAESVMTSLFQAEDFMNFMLYLEFGQTGLEILPPIDIPIEEEDQVIPVLPNPPPVIPKPPLFSLAPFTGAEGDAIAIGGTCTYAVDKASLIQKTSSLDCAQDGPTVLIVHTHASEAFTQSAGLEYSETETRRTQNPDYSVVRIGAVITEILQEQGISVIHDTSINDYPTYSGSYNRTLTKIEQWQLKYPSIEMVLDIHRDGATDTAGNLVAHNITHDGENMAQVMFVVGTDEGGLTHPTWKENLSLALQLQALLTRSIPDICRDLNLRTERFNQHATTGSLILEFGSAGNTLPEVLRTAEFFAHQLGDYILSQNNKQGRDDAE